MTACFIERQGGKFSGGNTFCFVFFFLSVHHQYRRQYILTIRPEFFENLIGSIFSFYLTAGRIQKVEKSFMHAYFHACVSHRFDVDKKRKLLLLQ